MPLICQGLFQLHRSFLVLVRMLAAATVDADRPWIKRSPSPPAASARKAATSPTAPPPPPPSPAACPLHPPPPPHPPAQALPLRSGAPPQVSRPVAAPPAAARCGCCCRRPAHPPRRDLPDCKQSIIASLSSRCCGAGHPRKCALSAQSQPDGVRRGGTEERGSRARPAGARPARSGRQPVPGSGLRRCLAADEGGASRQAPAGESCPRASRLTRPLRAGRHASWISQLQWVAAAQAWHPLRDGARATHGGGAPGRPVTGEGTCLKGDAASAYAALLALCGPAAQPRGEPPCAAAAPATPPSSCHWCAGGPWPLSGSRM